LPQVRPTERRSFEPKSRFFRRFHFQAVENKDAKIAYRKGFFRF
jgi:hypothetical protein